MAPPHTLQLAGRADWALMIAIHDALRRDLDQLLHPATSRASARARWGAFRGQVPAGQTAGLPNDVAAIDEEVNAGHE